MADKKCGRCGYDMPEFTQQTCMTDGAPCEASPKAAEPSRKFHTHQSVHEEYRAYQAAENQKGYGGMDYTDWLCTQFVNERNTRATPAPDPKVEEIRRFCEENERMDFTYSVIATQYLRYLLSKLDGKEQR